MQNSKRIPKPFLWLAVISLFPMVMGWMLFHYHARFQFKTLNHGVLLNPPMHAEYLYPASNEKKWHIIQVSGTMCDSQCQQLNHLLHQVQIALGKDRDRINVILINGQDKPLTSLKNNFIKAGYNNFLVENKIYLVDPLGNLFMYYPDSTDPVNILKDIKRVLEVSQIG